jgi:hypothetical protein
MSTTEQAAELSDLPDEPMPVAVQFASRGRHLTLERVHPRRQVDASGNAVWTDPVVYEFQDPGFLIVYPGQDVIRDKFDPATGEMHEQDAIEWLHSHELYGLSERGFWEVAPIAPPSEALMQKIMQLAVKAGDPAHREEAEAVLVAIHEREIETWGLVLGACKAALAAIESHAALSERQEPAPVVERETPPPPPGFTRGEDGVLRPDNPETIPVSSGPKPQSVEGGFSPDTAPVRAE